MESNDHTKELDILINLEYRLANHQWTNIYQMVADLSATLYPDTCKILSHEEQYPLLGELASFIQLCSKRSNGSFDTYTGKMLSANFYGRIQKHYTINDLRRFAGYLIVIKSVGDDGEISLDEEWARILSSPFGVPLLEKENSTSPTKTGSNPIITKKKVSLAKTEAEKRLEEFWLLIAKENFDYQYLWRNKIGTSYYKELKNRLKACANENKKGLVKRFPHAIALYIAEWYKREYNGNDGKDNAINEINLPCKAEEVWNCCKFSNIFLSKQKNRRYLESIYVLGGLPINYLINKQFNRKFKEIQSAYKQKSDEESLQQNLFITNNTLQESMHSQWGSLRLYFEALMNDDYPFAKEDYDKEPFHTFLLNLQEWNPMRKKFSIEWIIEGNEFVGELRRKIRLYVSPETNGERNRSISYSRLYIWGVSNKETSFNLYAFYNDQKPEESEGGIDIEHLTFYNTYDGYFTGKMSHNYFTFTNIPGGIIHKITLYIKASDGFKEIYSEDFGEYLQLYQTDEYSVLSSRKADTSSYVLLPYEAQVIEPANLHLEKKFFVDDDEPFKLIEITERVVIRDANNEKYEFYRRDDDLIIYSRTYDKEIAYQDDRLLKYLHKNEDNEWIKDYYEVIFNIADIKALSIGKYHEPLNLQPDDFVLEIKSIQDYNYHLWPEELPPSGPMKVRIKYHNIQYVKDFLYIQSKNKPFIRDCSNNTLSIDTSIILLEPPQGLSLRNYDGNGYHIYKEDYSLAQKVDCYSLKVECGNGYVKIPIYRALNIEELSADGNVVYTHNLTDNERATIEIPFLLKDRFSIRIINKNGVTRYNLKDDKTNYLDFDFDDTSSSISNSVHKNFKNFDISFYYCKDTLNIRQSQIYVDKHSKSYRFYYWSMKADEPPVLISFNSGNDLCLKSQYLSKSSGIIFQSLENNIKPIDYYAPILLGKWPLKDVSAMCFRIAAKHKTPFRIFSPIFECIKNSDTQLEDLAMKFIIEDNDGMSETDKLDALIRFSHEMYFSWPFLNRKTWKDMPLRILKQVRETAFINSDEYMELILDLISKGIEPAYFSKAIEKRTQEVIAQDINSGVSEKFRDLAKTLFLKCGENLSYENRKSLSEFTQIYWKHRNESGYHFASPQIQWDKWKKASGNKLEGLAVYFMRPFRDRYTSIGFTYKENNRSREGGRPIDKIRLFLEMLYTDEQSFIKIEAFLKENLFNYKSLEQTN